MKVTGGLRFRMCPDCNEFHDKNEWPDNHRRPEEAICAPQVIRDDMPAVQSMVDGSWHDSKRSIRKTYQPSGNREGKYYTEIGTEKQPPKKAPPIDRKGIRESMAKAQAKLARGEVTKRTYEEKVITRPGKL